MKKEERFSIAILNFFLHFNLQLFINVVNKANKACF
jgi:hypothetical protein